jgi:diguanylate cyclase (GGDEF)-like protein
MLSTKAVQQAIDDCAKAGGGRVVVPTGQYKIGSIVLKSGVNLYLEQGATLFGSTDLKDYLPMKSDYVSLRTQTSTIQLIYADNVKNVVIDGFGTIDGQGRAFKKLTWNDEGITRPHLIRFIQSQDITIKDITLKNSGCWMQHYLACDRVRIDGIKVFNRNNYNNDALDIDGCHEVIVRGIIADSDDDGITLKSTSPRLCENIRICDCVISSHCNAVKLGTETNGGFRNINISGIVVKPSSDQSSQFFGAPSRIGTSALSLEILDGGMLENVSASDFTVEGTESPIFIRLGNRGRGYKLKKTAKGLSGKGNDDTITELIPIEHIGHIDGIHLDNFQIRNAGPVGCSITGLPGYPARNVRLSNITIQHQGGVNEIDLKAINDSRGHEAGDELLRRAADILRQAFRQDDLYRMGGDEFLVIAVGISQEEFDRRVAILHDHMRGSAKVSFSIGALWSDGTTDVSTAYKRADAIMYADKEAYYASHPNLHRN